MSVESIQSKPLEFKLPPPNNHWNRGPDLQYTQRVFYAPPLAATVPAGPPPPTVGPPPSPAAAAQMSMWPRPPAYTNFMAMNSSLPAMPPHWHKDPSAMAWIASCHMMMPMTMAGAQHPHNYMPSAPVHIHNGIMTNGHLPNLCSPVNMTGAAADDVFPCEICGKSFTAKDALRQVL